jgi:hypothetical protein
MNNNTASTTTTTVPILGENLYSKLLLLEELVTATPALGLPTTLSEEEEEEGFLSGEDRSQTTKLQQQNNQLFSQAKVFVFFFSFSIPKHLGSFFAVVATHYQ